MSVSEGHRNLNITGVEKRFGSFKAVDNVSLTVERGEFLTLLGPSGSGKTTLLMMIAGFVQPDKGSIALGAEQITHLPPERRDFGMVFQGYALFPHLSVFDNVAFPLKVRKKPRAEIEERVRSALDLVQLTAQMDRLPRQLSGGQQQRVALARAMVFTPHLLLLDEPLSALDKKLRAELQEELKRLHRKVGLTFIYVTHDQDEALSMSDRIAIMRDGQLIQHGSPAELYENPSTAFVADFLGKSNFLRGRVETHAGDDIVFTSGRGRFRQRISGAKRPPVGSEIAIALRPEKISIVPPGTEMANTLTGTVTEWNYFGSEFRLVVSTQSFGSVAVAIPTWKSGVPPEIGQSLTLGWDAQAGMQVAES
ncbi:ABC transporter ATP-binding protein [Microvirga roseola]|uniref:ABC transporter ATP-binding protein n=1 Tax=Microvirga roseola TaxID=2883126 RepID=UPI001E3D9356|nr:ABC transporter ATP-binding protein [Microvirga roseola]